MRKLTALQLKILDSYPECQCTDDLPAEVLEKLKSINDTEILYQEVDRYLSDRSFSKNLNAKW